MDDAKMKMNDEERFRALYKKIAFLEKELADHESSFELRWAADMRAIKRWQTATGRVMTWPDHADLCVWLMEKMDLLQAALTMAKAECLEHNSEYHHRTTEQKFAQMNEALKL